MKSAAYQPVVHRLALLTACTALLPIVVGALVTTKGAGMAFPDWPTSDGHNMFLYPWLATLGTAFDKFIEHGHRLAGALIGLVSIGLVAFAWWLEPRRWVRVSALLVLLCVIAQGILGGVRVRMDRELLAMVHGNFAAIVFSFMAVVVLVTSRSWFAVAENPPTKEAEMLKPFAVITALSVFAQYTLGGLLRHLGRLLYEHIALAVLVLLCVILTFVLTRISRLQWLKGPALWMLAFVGLQVLLGLGAFATKFGFAPLGYVAVHDSSSQVLFRTAHTVVGMLLLMSSVVYAVRVFRLDGLEHRTGIAQAVAGPLGNGVLDTAQPVSGGAR
jgi:cytochrome c oxidase assembly protein subunit 15